MNPGEEQSQSQSRKKCNEEETDRPLKKAKYLWQVKGKYHLKDNQTSSSTQRKQNEDNLDLKSTVNHTLTQKKGGGDRSCIEAIIANSDKYMEFSLIDKNIDKSISDEIPITLVKQHHQTDDYYLRKWQARQIAKGFLDNTINRVLEHWMVAPFDAADFVENCDNGGQVEDEGILMAIQSHGLQSGTGVQMHSSLFQCNTRMANWEAQQNCTCTSVLKHKHKRDSFMPFHQRAEPDLNEFHYYEDKPPPPQEEEEEENKNLDVVDDIEMNDTDFLDAAVAVAIQKKGLTSLNCVDCG